MAGLDVELPTPVQAPAERVWEAMIDKVHHTEKYLPVSNVKTTEVKPDHVYGEMLFNGRVSKQDIYLDRSRYQIWFEEVGEDQVFITRYYPDADIIQSWSENRKDERIL